MLRPSLAAALVVALAPPMAVRAQTPEPLDAVAQAAIQQIRAEGLQRSQVMDLASWMTDVYGPRLTGSPGLHAAAEWAVQMLTGWGLTHVRQEAWGTCHRPGEQNVDCPGWQNDIAMARVVAPRPFQVYVTVPAGSASTAGVVRGEVVLFDTVSAEALETFRGQLKGKFVFLSPESVMRPPFRLLGRRYTDAELAALANGVDPDAASAQSPPPPAPPRRPPGPRLQLDEATTAFLAQEGALAVITTTRGSYGTMFPVGSAYPLPPTLAFVGFAAEHYGRIYRTVQKGVPVTLELQIQNTSTPVVPSTNLLAELPGRDPKLKDEVVMLGAHFDSWHYATGATDNAAGAAVMMEAMRILETLNLPLKRTVRLALWTGEENASPSGSERYVAQQFGGRNGKPTTSAHAQLSAYYNLDNGTGAIRGVYLEGNQAVEPIFRSWMAPFEDFGMTTLTSQGTGATDHVSFDEAGLPGFQFIQDPIDYDTRTHHSNMDTYERLQADDLRQNAVIVAAWVYLTANRAEQLPRKR